MNDKQIYCLLLQMEQYKMVSQPCISLSLANTVFVVLFKILRSAENLPWKQQV